MKKCSASSQSERYLDRQFPQGDEWKGSSAETKGWNVSSKLWMKGGAKENSLQGKLRQKSQGLTHYPQL